MNRMNSGLEKNRMNSGLDIRVLFGYFFNNRLYFKKKLYKKKFILPMFKFEF